MGATIGKNKNSYNRITAITLLKNLYLEEGLINNSSPNIDITAAGNTLLYTAAAGITGIDLSNVKLNLFGSNTVGGLILSIGTNSPNYDNIVPSTTLTGFNTIGDLWVIPISGLTHRIAASEAVYARVTNPVTGAGAQINAFFTGRII